MAVGMSPWRRRINSHEAFVHDSIDSLGYDWSRIADPESAPRYPLRIWLPRTTDDIVTALGEATTLGVRPAIRSKGHSSNDLVLSESVLVTEKLDRVLDIDEDAMTVTCQSGAMLSAIDEALAPRGLGLPIIGDHAHITIGGFTSVGGITAASFRHGLFVDNVERLELVTWDGEVLQVSRTENPEEFERVRTGLGRWGVVSTVTVRVIRIAKFSTIWRNRQTHHKTFDDFLDLSFERISNPPVEARFMKGMWVDFGRFAFGEFSTFVDTPQSQVARCVSEVGYRCLHKMGFLAGKLPGPIDQALKMVGMGGVLFSPPYAMVKYAEASIDKIIDSTVGDPTRYLAVIMREADYVSLTRRVFEVLGRYRKQYRCFTVMTAYVKGIRSGYLAAGNPADDRWAETVFYVGIVPDRFPPDVLEQLVTEIDDLCIEVGAYRYMHTRTTRDPARLARIDPNAVYAGAHPPWQPPGPTTNATAPPAP